MKKRTSDFEYFSRFAETSDISTLKEFQRQLSTLEIPSYDLEPILKSLDESPVFAMAKHANQIVEASENLSRASESARRAFELISPKMMANSLAAQRYLESIDLHYGSATRAFLDAYSENIILTKIEYDSFVSSDIFEAWQSSFNSTLLEKSRFANLFSELTRQTDYLGELKVPGDSGRVIQLSEAPQDRESLLDLPSSVGERLAEVQFIPLRLAQMIARDPTSMHSLSPREFEEFVAELLDSLGFENVKLTPQGGDGGKDVVAERRVNGIPIVVFVECKKFSKDRKVGVGIARSLIGSLDSGPEKATMGVIATTSTFTKDARDLIVGHSRLDGRDIDGLTQWVREAGWPSLFVPAKRRP